MIPSEISNKINEKNSINSVHYLCPVYKTSKRSGTFSASGISSNFLLNIKLPSNGLKNHDYWCKGGVALLTQLEDWLYLNSILFS